MSPTSNLMDLMDSSGTTLLRNLWTSKRRLSITICPSCSLSTLWWQKRNVAMLTDNIDNYKCNYSMSGLLGLKQRHFHHWETWVSMTKVVSSGWHGSKHRAEHVLHLNFKTKQDPPWIFNDVPTSAVNQCQANMPHISTNSKGSISSLFLSNHGYTWQVLLVKGLKKLSARFVQAISGHTR